MDNVKLKGSCSFNYWNIPTAEWLNHVKPPVLMIGSPFSNLIKETFKMPQSLSRNSSSITFSTVISGFPMYFRHLRLLLQLWSSTVMGLYFLQLRKYLNIYIYMYRLKNEFFWPVITYNYLKGWVLQPSEATWRVATTSPTGNPAAAGRRCQWQLQERICTGWAPPDISWLIVGL